MEDKTKIYIDQRRAMTQALEALENSIDLVEEDYANAVNLYGKYQSRLQRLLGMETMRDDHRKAITAIREALAELQEKYIYGTPLLDAMTGKANEALDKMAENAREIGLDYEPAQQEPFGHVTVRRLSQRFENHHDQYHFYPAGQSPYLDNVDECHAVYTSPQPAQKQEPVSLKSLAQKAGINLPETYIPTMDDAIAAGDSVLMNEQAALLRECRAALDSLIAQKPTLAGLLCGSTTLGNLKAELGAYRPKGVLGTPPASKPWVGLTDEEVKHQWEIWRASIPRYVGFAKGIEAKLKEKNI